MTRPITIVGGGLAGLGLALALRQRGIPVTLHEKRRYPFHRVCGEFLSGVSNTLLSRLQIEDCFAGAAPIRSMRWFVRDRLVLDRDLPRPAWGISRYTLDERLSIRAIEAGADLRTGSTFRGGDREGLVRASGKRLDRQSDWLGLSAHFENVANGSLEMHCGPDGYLGMSPIENGRMNVTGLFRKQPGVMGRSHELISSYLRVIRCEQLAARLEAARFVPGSFAAIAGFDFGFQRSDGFCLGDRSLLIPPFAGNGMSMAIEAAAQAAPLLTEYAKGSINWSKARDNFKRTQNDCFGPRMRTAARLHPFLFSPTGLRLLGTLAANGILPTERLFKSLR